MKIQSALSAAPQSPPRVPVDAQGYSESAFEDLLKDAMQTTSTPPPPQEKPKAPDNLKDKEPAVRAEDPAEEAPKAEDLAPGKAPPRAKESEAGAEDEPSEAVAQNLLAAAASPIVSFQKDETVVTDSENLQVGAVTASDKSQSGQAVQIQAPPAGPVDPSRQTALQAESALQSEDDPARRDTTGIEIVHAEQKSPEAHEAQAIANPAEIPADPKAQARFDAMVSKAEEELKGMQPQDESAAEPPLETARTPGEAAPRAAAKPVMEEVEALKEDTPEPIASVHAQTAAVEELSREIGSEEPQAAEATEAPTPARQVEAQIAERLEEGKSEFTMRLNPESLGRVTVKLVMDDGKLAVHIAAATQKAVDALKKESEGLMASMRLAGVAVETVVVVPETDSASGHMESPFDMATGQGGEGAGEQGQQGGPAAGRAYASADESPEALKREAQPDRLLDQAV
ncbi:MAG: flagellar hook-length control protein FliK [Oscillospiraceae bacterium]|jgi:flagellar hook-length control protein FliK|nr:flagellar hook-length control protein FliK [Oscillospiraceae bacterium]